MKFAFIMDPLETVKADKDTTYFLMWAAFQKGHEVHYVDQDDLFLQHNQLFGETKKLKILDRSDFPFEVQKQEIQDLSSFDIVWVRKDPPFDRRYFYTTLLLDFLPKTVRVLNRPDSLRSWNEKLGALFYEDLTPETMISSNAEELFEFVEKKKGAVLKPLDGFGGRGISILKHGEKGNKEKIESLIGEERQKVILQEFVPQASEGDKRILLVQGEPIGAILRKSDQDGGLNNLDQGGSAYPADLTEREKEICRRLKERMISEGLFFVGIDILGDYLTEVNVTSPTGLQELARFSGIDHHLKIIETLEG